MTIQHASGYIAGNIGAVFSAWIGLPLWAVLLGGITAAVVMAVIGVPAKTTQGRSA